MNFTVYNRWGKKIYESITDGGDVKWDGKTENGEPAVTGTYYYHAEVEYLSIFNAPPPLSLNGWVHIVY